MASLPTYTYQQAFFVSWTGTDNLSGVDSYDVQWRTTSGNWQNLIKDTKLTSFQFTGAQNGVTYQFRARAEDAVGNVQPYSDQAQSETTVFTHATATVQPFATTVLKPTAPVTDTFTVNWTFDAGPTTPKETRVFYRYDQGTWTLWNVFNYPTLSAPFSWKSLGLGDGLYEFEAVAVNTLNQFEPQKMESEAFIYVDMADAFIPRGYMPIVAQQP
jgi:hypothetical protein